MQGKDDETLIMVGDGVEDEDQLTPDDEKEAKEEKLTAIDEEGNVLDEFSSDGEGEDKRVGAGEAEEDDKREARRLERQQRKIRRKEARARDERELNYLRKRNEQVEKQLSEIVNRLDSSEKVTLDGRIAALDRAIAQAEEVHSKAVEAKAGGDATEAIRIRDKLKEQRSELASARDSSKSNGAGGEVDPVFVELVRDWHSRNKWFDFNRSDEDSAIAGAIDDLLVRQGYDPRTPEYYEELDKRIGEKLPHLAVKKVDEDEDEEVAKEERGKKKPSGPKFRAGGKEAPLRKNQVRVSRERREAMEEMGVWDDPVLRNKYLKRFADWDRDNADTRA